MPDIEETHDEDEAHRILRYWQDQLDRLGGSGIAEITMKHTRPGGVDTWIIELYVWVSEDSQAYKDFMRNWRG